MEGIEDIKKSAVKKDVETLKEILIEAPNQAGVLASLIEAITGKGSNILALSASTSADKAWIHVITNDNAKALKAVSTLGWSAQERDVISVSLENKVRTAHSVSLRLASADVNIETVYGPLWDTGDAKKCALIVVPSDDVAKAIEVLEATAV